MDSGKLWRGHQVTRTGAREREARPVVYRDPQDGVDRVEVTNRKGD